MAAPTPEQVAKAAHAWFLAQLAAAEAKHGARWPEHREWVEAYLREELRARLVAIGWRARQ